MKLVINPYRPGPPVSGASFYGRKDLLDRVRRELAYSNVVLLEGQRRIGKTSFLHQLRTLLQGDGPDSLSFLPLSFDIQAYVGDTAPEFKMHLARATARRFQLPVPELTEWEFNPVLFRQRWLPQVFERLGGRYLVLLVDEFDNLAEPAGGHSVETLLPFIGSLVAREERLKWVFTVGRHKGNLPIQYDSIIAPAIKLSLGRLSREETRQLIEDPASSRLSFQPGAVERLFELTSGQPHLTQALCKEVFDLVVLQEGRREAKSDDVDVVLDSTLSNYEGAISSIARVPAVEERVQAAVARLTAEDGATSRNDIVNLLVQHEVALALDELDRALERLVEWDALVHDDQGWRPAIELVRIWVARNISVTPSRFQKLDLAEARANSRYEFAEEAYRRGQVKVAIEEFQEVLKYHPMHRGALSGLAEAYRVTGNLPDQIAVLQQLHRLDPSVRPDLVEALAERAETAKRAGEPTLAAEDLESLIELQGVDRWGQELLQARLQEAEQHVEKVKDGELSDEAVEQELTKAQQALDRGLAVDSEGPGAEALRNELKKIERLKWISAVRDQVHDAEKSHDLEAAARALLELHEEGVELSPKEQRTLKTAAFDSLHNKTSVFHRWLPWLTGTTDWFRMLIGGLLGLAESLLLIGLVGEAGQWSPLIYAGLTGLNVGLVRALGKRRAKRLLAANAFATAVAAGVLWLAGDSAQFPPSSLGTYVLLTAVVVIPLSMVRDIDVYSAGGFESWCIAFTGLVGSSIGGLLGGALGTWLDNALQQPVAAGLGLSLSWLVVDLAVHSVGSSWSTIPFDEAVKLLGDKE